jgi:signal transduction histidine kinase
MGRLKGRRFLPILSILVIIIVISYSLFFYLQYIIEKETKQRLFYQQIEGQLDSTEEVSRHIGTDFDTIILGLDGLANSVYLQQEQPPADKTRELVAQTHLRLNTITLVEELLIVDNNNNIDMMYPVAQSRNESTLSDLDKEKNTVNLQGLLNETKARLAPAFSNGFKSADNNYRIALSYPIFDGETEQYIGTIVAVIPTAKFFEHYGNIHNINKQYLVAYDKSGAYLASPVAIGSPASFANEIQQFIKYNKNLNDKVVLSGRPGGASVNEFGIGDRLSTGYPIMVQGKHAYSLFVVTPTSSIYSQVNEVLFLERVEMFLLLSGTTIAVAVLIMFLYRWNNSLDREVKRRTKELAELNDQLRISNEQLIAHDKMQTEFINIAAHELRTPLQPIISYNALASKGMIDKDESFRVIGKQARRLQKLANDLLAINRIESGDLSYKMGKVRVNDLIAEVVNSYYSLTEQNIKRRNNFSTEDFSIDKDGGGKVSIKTELDHNIGEIYADKDRIVQVLTNIIDNALKFTKKGVIKVTSNLIPDKNEVEVKISDTGSGIPIDILHNIFDKFATKNIARKEKEHGSGLGLYISNAIITAHRGKIAACNNVEGGATFTIVLPLSPL